MQRFTDALQLLYRYTAPHYEARIAPVMRVFAQSLVREADLENVATALDLGTGTGILARELAGQVRQVFGIDLSLPMLRAAHEAAAHEHRRGVSFVLADVERLACLPDSCCDAVFASFGLGETDPRRVFRAVARALRPGGQFYLQEWGPYDGEDDPRLVLDETLAGYLKPGADRLREELRRLLDEPRPWDDQLQDTGDYVDALAEAGFVSICAAEDRPAVVTFQAGIAGFLNYALAWAWRDLEIRALDPGTQKAFRAEVTRRMTPVLDPTGTLHWCPVLFRVNAVRKL